MAFKFRGSTHTASTGVVVAKCNIAGREVTAIADSFGGDNGSEKAHVIRIEGIGKPVSMGAMKFCAITEMADQIAAHFKAIGQIE